VRHQSVNESPTDAPAMPTAGDGHHMDLDALREVTAMDKHPHGLRCVVDRDQRRERLRVGDVLPSGLRNSEPFGQSRQQTFHDLRARATLDDLKVHRAQTKAEPDSVTAAADQRRAERSEPWRRRLLFSNRLAASRRSLGDEVRRVPTAR
jgi:hypothetical protein